MTLEKLQNHFSDTDQWPVFLTNDDASLENKNEDADYFEICCLVPKTLSWFKGHFPEQPVLPGVVQINWASEIAQLLMNVKEFRGVSSLKFNTMVLPDTKVVMSLKHNLETKNVKFTYKNGEILYSSGVLNFAQSL